MDERLERAIARARAVLAQLEGAGWMVDEQPEHIKHRDAYALGTATVVLRDLVRAVEATR